jgi:hypothetical protein
VRACVSLYVCVRVCVYVRACLCMHVYIYLYVCMYVNKYDSQVSVGVREKIQGVLTVACWEEFLYLRCTK